jgi:predicted O-methyltransferase YrrM
MRYIEKKISSRFNYPRRIYRKLWRVYAKKTGFCKVTTSDQNQIFHEIGLSRESGLNKLNDLLMKFFGRHYDEKDGMYSEHLVTLSSISCLNHSLKNILEIGTYDGRTALILSELFEGANILSIDLPATDNDFESMYSRKGKVQDFVENRNKNLGASKQIRFLEANSISLTNIEEKFDLIWIDGAHGYPVVAMDIINSYRLCKKGGYVLIDDVLEQVDYSDKHYTSIAAHESLSELKIAKLINDFHLIPKRLGAEFNLPWVKKHVGIFRRL